MPYDFEEVFSRKPTQENNKPVEQTTPQSGVDMSVSEKESLFNKPNTVNAATKDINEMKNLFANATREDAIHKPMRSLDFKQIFKNFKEPHLNEFEKEQKDLRSLMVKNFLDELAPLFKKTPTFNYSTNRFKLLVSINSLITAVITMLFLSPLVLLIALCFIIGFFLLQFKNSILLDRIEGHVWKTIKNLPPVQLKQLLHSILSNNFVADSYTEEDIKEIIFNFLQQDNHEAQESATIKIRDSIVAVKAILTSIYSGAPLPHMSTGTLNPMNIELTPINIDDKNK